VTGANRRSLSDSSWPELAESMRAGRGTSLLVPVGSCEQHGPHLTFDVDAEVARAVAVAVARNALDLVVAPPLAYGASGEHEGFPGTVSVSHAALTMMLEDIAHSASLWAQRVLFVNGHGGNSEALVAATARARDQGLEAAWWPCMTRGGDAHAGRTETSLMLALRPQSVRLDRARAGPREPIDTLMPALRRRGVMAISPSGVLGDPEGASRGDGERLLATMVRRLAAAVARWTVCPDGRLSSTRARSAAPIPRTQAGSS
jgi:mycofactocin system creatininase family protein